MAGSLGGPEPIAAPLVTLVLFLRMRQTSNVNGGEPTKGRKDPYGGQGHSRAPKASEAENRLIAPPTTRASLFWTHTNVLWNMDASMHQPAQSTPVVSQEKADRRVLTIKPAEAPARR